VMLRADLDTAQRHYEDGLRLATDAGNKSLVAAALAGLGEVQLRRGDIDGARRRHEEALAIRVGIGADGDANESRVLLAALALQDGRFADAVAQSRQLPQAFHKIGAPETEARAHVVLARGLLAAGDVRAAQAELRSARGMVGRVVPPELRFDLAVA